MYWASITNLRICDHVLGEYNKPGEYVTMYCVSRTNLVNMWTAAASSMWLNISSMRKTSHDWYTAPVNEMQYSLEFNSRHHFLV